MNNLEKALLGALVGLARVCYDSEYDYQADFITISSLQKLRDGNVLEEDIKSVQKQKYLISPGCLSCKTPCGNTDDYNVDSLYLDSQRKDIKLEMINSLYQLASKDVFSEDLMQLIYKGLYVLKEEWEVEYMMPILEELKQAEY